MILRKCAFVICLLSGLGAPFQLQSNPQSERQAEPHVSLPLCPEGSDCVDVCKLAAQLDNKNATQIKVGAQSQFPAHDAIRLGYGPGTKKQVIWTCSAKSFQITQIQRVRDRDAQGGLDMPFDLKLYKEKLRVPQNAGAQLASGPPVPGADGTYKFSFIIAEENKPLCGIKGDPPVILSSGTRYDPHIIVTGTGGGKPSPTPTPDPHKNEKPSSQKGGAGGSAKR